MLFCGGNLARKVYNIVNLGPCKLYSLITLYCFLWIHSNNLLHIYGYLLGLGNSLVSLGNNICYSFCTNIVCLQNKNRFFLQKYNSFHIFSWGNIYSLSNHFDALHIFNYLAKLFCLYLIVLVIYNNLWILFNMGDIINYGQRSKNLLNIKKKLKLSIDDYVIGSLLLYATIIQLFLRIIEILAIARGRW